MCNNKNYTYSCVIIKILLIAALQLIIKVIYTYSDVIITSVNAFNCVIIKIRLSILTAVLPGVVVACKI